MSHTIQVMQNQVDYVAQRLNWFLKNQKQAVLEWMTTFQEAVNRPNIPSQEKFHRNILRGLRSISDTPYYIGVKFLL